MSRKNVLLFEANFKLLCRDSFEFQIHFLPNIIINTRTFQQKNWNFVHFTKFLSMLEIFIVNFSNQFLYLFSWIWKSKIDIELRIHPCTLWILFYYFPLHFLSIFLDFSNSILQTFFARFCSSFLYYFPYIFFTVYIQFLRLYLFHNCFVSILYPFFLYF